MSVIIKNFDMPTRCAECILCIDKKNNDYGYFGKCLLQNKETVDCLMWTRDKGCPLTESEVEGWLK